MAITTLIVHSFFDLKFRLLYLELFVLTWPFIAALSYFLYTEVRNQKRSPLLTGLWANLFKFYYGALGFILIGGFIFGKVRQLLK